MAFKSSVDLPIDEISTTSAGEEPNIYIRLRDQSNSLIAGQILSTAG